LEAGVPKALPELKEAQELVQRLSRVLTELADRLSTDPRPVRPPNRHRIPRPSWKAAGLVYNSVLRNHPKLRGQGFKQIHEKVMEMKAAGNLKTFAIPDKPATFEHYVRQYLACIGQEPHRAAKRR
jgi:hypothetical protein